MCNFKFYLYFELVQRSLRQALRIGADSVLWVSMDLTALNLSDETAKGFLSPKRCVFLNFSASLNSRTFKGFPPQLLHSNVLPHATSEKKKATN